MRPPRSPTSSRLACCSTDRSGAIATHFLCDCTQQAIAVSQHFCNTMNISEIRSNGKPGTNRARVVLLHSPKGLKRGRRTQSARSTWLGMIEGTKGLFWHGVVWHEISGNG